MTQFQEITSILQPAMKELILKKANNVARMNSDEIGAVDLIGTLDYKETGLKDVKFIYTAKSGKEITRDNIGSNDSRTLLGNGLRHTMKWKGNGISIEYLDIEKTWSEVSANTLSDNNAAIAKIKVKDSGNKAYSYSTVIFDVSKVAKDGSTTSYLSLDLKADKDGIVTFDKALYERVIESQNSFEGKLKIDIRKVQYADWKDGESGELYEGFDLTIKPTPNPETQTALYMNDEIIQ